MRLGARRLAIFLIATGLVMFCLPMVVPMPLQTMTLPLYPASASVNLGELQTFTIDSGELQVYFDYMESADLEWYVNGVYYDSTVEIDLDWQYTFDSALLGVGAHLIYARVKMLLIIEPEYEFIDIVAVTTTSTLIVFGEEPPPTPTPTPTPTSSPQPTPTPTPTISPTPTFPPIKVQGLHWLQIVGAGIALAGVGLLVVRRKQK
jgi:hypothetical protein